MTGSAAGAARSPWSVVWLGFVALALAYSVRALLGLAMPVRDRAGPWSQGWSSAAGSVALLGMGISAPVLGVLLGDYALVWQSSAALAVLAALMAAAIGRDDRRGGPGPAPAAA